MTPTRKVSRRSFLGRVAGAAVGGGALLGFGGRATAIQTSDSDTGQNADPVGRGRASGGAAAEPSPAPSGAAPSRAPRSAAPERARTAAVPPRTGDSDFERPVPMGDTFQSDPPPGPRTGVTDRDGGPAGDPAGYGAGRNRAAVQAERCAEARRRLARYAAMPRRPDSDERVAALRGYLGRVRCG